MEGNPAAGQANKKEAGHIPGIPEDTYEKKIARLRQLEDMIKQDEELGQSIKVDLAKGVTPEIAGKIMRDSVQRLAKNRAERDALMGLYREAA